MRTRCARPAGRQNSGSFRGEHDEEPPTAGAGSATHIHDVDAQGSHAVARDHRAVGESRGPGLSLMPTERLIKSLGASIAMRLTPRAGKNIYQTAE